MLSLSSSSSGSSISFCIYTKTLFRRSIPNTYWALRYVLISLSLHGHPDCSYSIGQHIAYPHHPGAQQHEQQQSSSAMPISSQTPGATNCPPYCTASCTDALLEAHHLTHVSQTCCTCSLLPHSITQPGTSLPPAPPVLVQDFLAQLDSMSGTATAAVGPAAAAAAAAGPAAVSGRHAGYDMFSGLPVPGGLSERLWLDTQPEVMEALHHPFVQALAAGTLDRSAHVCIA